jgi:site-specific recombinase XerD
MQETGRAMHTDAIDRVLRKHAKAIGMDRGYSTHSMRATFITTALENGTSLEAVQRAAGHPGTGHDQALRPTRLQSRKISKFLRYVLV